MAQAPNNSPGGIMDHPSPTPPNYGPAGTIQTNPPAPDVLRQQFREGLDNARELAERVRQDGGLK